MRTYLFLLGSAVPIWVCSQQIGISLKTPTDTVLVDQVFEIKWEFDKAEVEVEPLVLVGLEKISGPTTGRSMSTVNGVTTNSSYRSFRVRATQPGTYPLPVLRARLNANEPWQEFTASAIIVSVKPMSKQITFATATDLPDSTYTIRMHDNIGYLSIHVNGKDSVLGYLEPPTIELLKFWTKSIWNKREKN